MGDRVPGAIKGHLGYVLSHQQDHNILPLIENAVEARTELASALAGNRSACPLLHPAVSACLDAGAPQHSQLSGVVGFCAAKGLQWPDQQAWSHVS